MSDYDGNIMDMWSDWDPLSSPGIREILAMRDQNENGLNPISETFPQTNLSTDPQFDKRSGGLSDTLAARRGFNISPLKIESVNPFAKSFRDPILVPSPILEISPGFSSLSPFLQSPNMLSNSSSQIIPPCPIPNDGPPETVESSGCVHARMMISNNNFHHQPMDVGLPPQEGTDDIPPHESNADLIGAPFDPSFDSKVVAETDIMNLISHESGSKDDDKDREYNQEEDKVEDHNIVVESSSRKRRKNVVLSNMMGVVRQKKTEMVIIQVESEEEHPDDGFRWRKYGQKLVRGNANSRSYYRCTYNGCNAKKLVERSAEDVKFVVASYEGIHDHDRPSERIRKFGTKNQTGSSTSQDPSNQTPQLDMMQYYMDGISKLPSLPVNQNHGVMNQNDEPKIDRVIPDGTEVFKGIWERLFRNFGNNL